MTIKEFYEWAQDVGATDAEIELQYQDGAGVHEGSCSMTEIELMTNSDGKVTAVCLC